MSASLGGRALAAVGVIAGLLAVALDLLSSGASTARYLDHGAVAAFLIALLSFASYLPAEVGFDTAAAAAGSAAFGFYLFVPGLFAFNQLGALGAAAWLGLATVLVPIGWAIVRALEREPRAAPSPPATSAELLRDPIRAQAFAGLAMIVAGIWLPAASGGATYWDGSSSGHALGLLMLLAVIANLAVLAPGIAVAQDTGLLLAAGTFGLVEAELVESAFDHLGSIGVGGWLEAAGGLLLIASVVAVRLGAARPRHGARAPAAAS